MFSLKVHCILLVVWYIQKTWRSNHALTGRLQEDKNNGNSKAVNQKTGGGRF